MEMLLRHLIDRKVLSVIVEVSSVRDKSVFNIVSTMRDRLLACLGFGGCQQRGEKVPSLEGSFVPDSKVERIAAALKLE